MEKSHKDRINKLIEALGLSKNKFAKAIGTSSAVVSKITTTDVNYGIELAEKIISTFPSVNPTWLLTGNGEMMLPNPPFDSPIVSPSDSPHEKKWRQEGESREGDKEYDAQIIKEEKRITNVIEAQQVGGERAARWADIRMLESRMYKRHPELEPYALHEAFELSGVGAYSDKLLTYLTRKTHIEIDDILALLLDKKITNTEAISRIKAVTAPIDALSHHFITAEKAIFDMIRAVVHQYPETEEMISGSPIALDIMGDIQFLTDEEAEGLE